MALPTQSTGAFITATIWDAMINFINLLSTCIDANGYAIRPPRTVSAAGTTSVLATDSVLFGDTTSNDVTFQLPNVLATPIRTFTVYFYAGTHVLSVIPQTGQFIYIGNVPQSSYVYSSLGQSRDFYNNGSGWFLI